MIRRSAKQRDGSAAWLLVEQMAHAHLAAELARAWSGTWNDGSEDARQWDLALDHHDDGWAVWDLHPGLRAGVPIAFHEMAVRDALPIWESSIRTARLYGPLAGYCVAQHFLRLRERSADLGSSPQERAFRERYERFSRLWSADPAITWSRDRLERAVEQLQFFDRLSLLLCGESFHTKSPLSLPDGDQCQLRPFGPGRYQMTPYPFDRSPLRISCRAGLVPVAPYRDGWELRRAWRTARLTWTIVPSESNSAGADPREV